jgi:hypothetical protein
MRKLWAAGAAIVMCLALGGMPVAAQVSPGPAYEQPLPLVTVGTSGPCTTIDRGTRGTSDGLVRLATGARDQTFECEMAISDPRVSGTATGTFNDDCFAGGPRGFECVFWGTQTIEGPDGSWDCTYSGTGDPMGGNDGLILHVCAGTGGYDGLTFMAQEVVSFEDPADLGDGTSIHGVLYEGPPPPPLEPASE